MAVGIKVGNITDEIGTSDFLFSFFSTVSANLEHVWGSRFPRLLNDLYSGEMSQASATEALGDLATICTELAALSPSTGFRDCLIYDLALG